jgi:REP element-mobilizing transposase RayT
MNLSPFNTTNLFEAATDLFRQLGIKLNSNYSDALKIEEVLKGQKLNTPVYKTIGKTFFIGIIDDSVFARIGMFDVNYSYKEALQQADKSYEGLMLFALELSQHPNRSEISELTRAFNRISQKMPVALVLKYPMENENTISISISERFKYKQNWWQGEKAGKVIILRDIHTQTTHAGHLRILLDLVKPVGVTNYAQLHEHWLQVLDVSILNKKFFQELANWYFWTMDNVQFPDDIEKKKDVRNATNLIRLITRVIFIWFIKEKSLVPNSLFNKTHLLKILKNFNKNEKADSYYQAILQNLFFGTLNQKMNERKFAETHGGFVKGDQGVRNIYRFLDKFLINEDEIKKLFKDVPFLNGGLFDCLDKTDEETKKDFFVDGFTRRSDKQASVPDYLFFGEETEVDLNEIYATKNKKYKVKGLVNLLESYKFTVAENTPIEEEIALDPELLGKVFENLLASYNPETQTTARKQTGSFYTPREIVNYMVDESLLEYLKSTVSILADGGQDVDTFFDPNNEIQIHTGNLPHWQQENVWYFITFRLADSIPDDVAEEIKSERELWLKKNPKGKDGSYSKEELKEYYRLFSERVETLLNAGKGSCVLRNEKTAKIVADALLHFNNQRYVLDEWVIMPNHVHVLVKLLAEYKLPDILHSWKSFTANKINEQHGKKGQLWMHESYDHIVRNEKALHAIRNYIRQSPAKAGIVLPDCAQSTASIPADGMSTVSISASELNSNRSKDASYTFDNRLRDLFSYSENPNPFNEKETKILIEAINNCKILDPACGSGAFPMGVLHKMVHILQKLDKENILWKALQRQKAIEETEDAYKSDNKEEREKRLIEINDVFENNASDYGRKLYLIENCIYGIDIQPIAVQIAKLRFFISLIIDQNKQEGKENFGIRSLPNLETKFVAANSLIGLEIPTTDLFSGNNPIKDLQDELKNVRHLYFNAKSRNEKLQFQNLDKQLRKSLSKKIKTLLVKINEDEIIQIQADIKEVKLILQKIEKEPERVEIIETTNLFGEKEQKKINKKQEKIKSHNDIIKQLENKLKIKRNAFNKDTVLQVAENIASFDPYDQNHFANWFEPEWMFGNDVAEGFDIIIGNPPWGAKLEAEEKELYKTTYNDIDSSTPNTFSYFIGWAFKNYKSVISYVLPDSILIKDFAKTRSLIKDNISEIVWYENTGIPEEHRPFVYVDHDVCVMNMFKRKSENLKYSLCRFDKSIKQVAELKFTQAKSKIILEEFDFAFNLIAQERDFRILKKISRFEKLDDFMQCHEGIHTGNSREILFLDNCKNKHCHPLFLGGGAGDTIENYLSQTSGWFVDYRADLIDKAKGFYASLRDERIFKHPKIYITRTGNPFKAFYDETTYASNNFFSLQHIDYSKNESQFLKFILPFIISKPAQYFIRTFAAPRLGSTFIETKIFHLLKFRIPTLTTKEQKPFVNLVDKIISTKEKNTEADTSPLEKQLDEMVYKLYDLTEEEIKTIEGN